MSRNEQDLLQEKIDSLPKGSIVTKKINGKNYFYHRWYDEGKRKEKYISDKDADILKKQIEERKSLESELKAMQKNTSKTVLPEQKHDFKTNIRTGNALLRFSNNVKKYKKRNCYKQLHDYIYYPTNDKVFILYGLRRTGKTTMIRQIFADMDEEKLRKSAFIQITANDHLADINADLYQLEATGYEFIFIDEVTLMDDFIEGAALFSDIFASSNMHIVLSGTDSLGFLFAEDEQLYDRCIMMHTTFISYQEFEEVLGIYGIDEFIRYGGTMSLQGINYHESSTFSSKESTDEYVDSAIARNIQHSLRCYQYADHFRHLEDLYRNNELTNVINRVVEDINHRFTLEVLTREFKSNDLGISASNLRRDRKNPTDILDRVQKKDVTERLRKALEIRNLNEQSVKLDDVHVLEIKEYLHLLDLVEDIDIISLPHVSQKKMRTLITQPGLRYAQADALVESLLQDEAFNDLSLSEKNQVIDRIRNEIKGRMMEDIILLETKLSDRKKDVFVLQFAIGEFDMVVFNGATSSCEIFEIKHTDQINENQYRHLIDEKKCSDTEFRYGKIKGKYVIYRGKTTEVNGIHYVNVEEYLKSLHKKEILH